MKHAYEIPTTNVEGLALLWTVIYPAELARQLGVSRAATAKWKSVPLHHLEAVMKITKLPRSHLLPEVYGKKVA